MVDLNKLVKLSHLRSGLIWLAGAVTEALEEMAAAKADKPSAVSATLPATGWNRDGSSAYPYYTEINFPSNLTNSDFHTKETG